jgi:hypothetical protein
MLPALEPRKEDPRIGGVSALEAFSIVLLPSVPTVSTHGLRQQAKGLSLGKVVTASIPVNRTEWLYGRRGSVTAIDRSGYDPCESFLWPLFTTVRVKP